MIAFDGCRREMTKSQLTIELPAGREQMLKASGHSDYVMTSFYENNKRALWIIAALALIATAFAVLYFLVMFGVMQPVHQHSEVSNDVNIITVMLVEWHGCVKSILALYKL